MPKKRSRKVTPQWAKWETDVQEALKLRGTIASGNQHIDIGDGVTPEGHPIPFIVDCKDTEKKSFSVNSEMLDDWLRRAAEQGQMFAMPIRFENAAKNKDYIVLSFEDFQTLWWLSKKYLEEN